MKKYKVGIYGVGAVGNAVSKGLANISTNEVINYDLRLNTPFDEIIKTDIIFICLPSPSKENGDVDMSIIQQEVKRISEAEYKGLVCLKSTIKPGTTVSLSNQYQNLKFSFVPEFLRERCAFEDFTENHDLLVIGTENSEHSKMIEEIHGSYPNKVAIVPPLEAELIKYFSNVYNAVRVTFANNFYSISKALGANYDTILSTYLLRGLSTGQYLKCDESLRGYGGMCLPKDTKAISYLMKELKIPLDLIHTIDSDNEKYKKTVFNGMRE